MATYTKINTLRTLTWQFLRHPLVAAGDRSRDNRFDEREVMKVMRQISHRLLKGEWFQARNNGEKNIDGHYIATFNNVTVSNDTVQKRNYCLLPAEYMMLRLDMGIQAVYPMSGIVEKDREAIIPIPSGAMDIFYQLPAGALEGFFSYEVHRNRLYFNPRWGKTMLTEKILKVRIRMVIISPEDIDPDTAYPMPPELQDTLISETLKWYGFPGTPDLINDNAPNPVRI